MDSSSLLTRCSANCVMMIRQRFGQSVTCAREWQAATMCWGLRAAGFVLSVSPSVPGCALFIDLLGANLPRGTSLASLKSQLIKSIHQLHQEKVEERLCQQSPRRVSPRFQETLPRTLGLPWHLSFALEYLSYHQEYAIRRAHSRVGLPKQHLKEKAVALS